MQGYNVIIVYHPDGDKLLMCLRTHDPYKGLYNLVGGKIEPNECGLEAAYRELYEETGISQDVITLYHLMDFNYPYQDCYVEAYVGRLTRDVTLVEEKHALYWLESHLDYFDRALFAGEGNIGHMLEQVKMSAPLIWKE